MIGLRIPRIFKNHRSSTAATGASSKKLILTNKIVFVLRGLTKTLYSKTFSFVCTIIFACFLPWLYTPCSAHLGSLARSPPPPPSDRAFRSWFAPTGSSSGRCFRPLTLGRLILFRKRGRPQRSRFDLVSIWGSL